MEAGGFEGCCMPYARPKAEATAAIKAAVCDLAQKGSMTGKM